MTSYNPVIKNSASGAIFYVSLAPRTATGAWQANPTLAAGDVKIAIDDGAPANLGTLPAVDADFTKRVKVTLSQAETNGDNLTIIFSDAAGAEWSDLTINIQTVSGNFDTIVADTNELQTDWVNGGRLDLILDARASQTSVDDVPTNTELASAFTEIKGATWSAVTDTLEAIRDRGDAAWVTATGFATHSAADVWAVATRVLTAGTNIQLPSNGLANVVAWTVAITGNVTGNLSGSVGSVTGLTASDVGAIKTTTDKFVFTVANQVDANVQYVNDVLVTGTGATGDEWGP